jgi:glycosyltransferase involved in cell wall biosynthesis
MADVDNASRHAAAAINGGRFDVLFANTSLNIAVSSIGRHVRLPGVLYLQEPSRWLYEARPAPIWAGDPTRERSAWSPATWHRSVRTAFQVRGFRHQARAEWRNLRAFRRILVNSRFSREAVLGAYGLNANVCYLGVDTEKFRRRPLPREDSVIGVGAIAPHKNASLAIEALGRLPRPRPRLLWIGDAAAPDYLAELRRLARACDVEFTPSVRVDDETLIDALSRASMMVYTARLEPFGLAPLEANACGLPVVAVAEGGVRETIQDGVNGMLVEHDPELVADAIQYLRTHPDEAARMGEAGTRLVAERWTVTAAVDRLEHHLHAAALTHAPDRVGAIMPAS